MSDDPRCCGSGTCIIDAEGICWCGQRWDGDRHVGPASACAQPAANNTSNTTATQLAEVLGHTDIGQIARGFVGDHGRITTVDMGPVVERHNGLARRLVGG